MATTTRPADDRDPTPSNPEHGRGTVVEVAFTARRARRPRAGREELAAPGPVEALPTGRVLRGMEATTIRRRIEIRAQQARIRPGLWSVLQGVLTLTVGYGRLRDEVPLAQLGRLLARSARPLGAELAELALAGVVVYRPGRGRGRAGTLGIPPELAGAVLVRLRDEGRWTPPPPPPPPSRASATATGPDVTAAPSGPAHVPENATPVVGVFGEASSYSSPNTPTGRAADEAKACDGSPPQPEGASAPNPDPTTTDPAQRATVGHRVAEVLDAFPAVLRTGGGSRDRDAQAGWVNELLRAGYQPAEIVTHMTLALPDLVWSAVALVAYRAKRLLTREAPAARRTREQRRRAADRRRERLECDQARRVDVLVRSAVAELPLDSLAAAIDTVRLGEPQLAGPLTAATRRALTATLCVALRPDPALLTVHATGTADHDGDPAAGEAALRAAVTARAEQLLAKTARVPRPVTASTRAAAQRAEDLDELVAALAAPASSTGYSSPSVSGSAVAAAAQTTVSTVLVSGESTGVCVACGRVELTARPRPQLPLGSVVCDGCLVEHIVDGNAASVAIGDTGLGAPSAPPRAAPVSGSADRLTG